MRSRLGIAILLLVTARGAAAQESKWDRFLPHVHYFKPLIADPMEPRLGLALMQTNIFERAGEGTERTPFLLPDPEDASYDVQAAVVIGGSLPLWQFKEWPGKGGVVASAQAGVFARFRIEYPTREEAATDWFVGMPIEVTYNRFEGRVRVMHQSSHLGDEVIELTGADRIEFGSEFVDFIAAYHPLEELRVYGGATYNFRSNTEIIPALREIGWHDRFEMQAGFDGGWYPWSNGRAGVVGGFDWQMAQRANFHPAYSLAAGIAARTPTRATRLLLRHYRGLSTMGEFFLTPERFWSLEWVLDF